MAQPFWRGPGVYDKVDRKSGSKNNITIIFYNSYNLENKILKINYILSAFFIFAILEIGTPKTKILLVFMTGSCWILCLFCGCHNHRYIECLV
jgi:hypothetical protein